MILSALSDYYARLVDDPDSGISQPGYSLEKISYAIVLDKEGNVVAVDDIRDTSGKKPTPKMLSVPASFKRPGIGSKPFFLWDKTSYALGIGKDEARIQQNLESFKELHRQKLAESNDPGLKALLSFIVAWMPEQFHINPNFVRSIKEMPESNVVFRFDGELRYIHERPAARDLVATQCSDSDASDGFCLVSGGKSKIARIHPSIKGIQGTDKAETSIVSFNKQSFESYGKGQGENAPVSNTAAEAYTTALNHLLRSKGQRINIGDANVVFWAQADDSQQAEAAENLLNAFFNPPSDDGQEAQRLRSVLDAVAQGRPMHDLALGLDEGTRAFVLGLAPNASRLSIRFWQTDTLDVFVQRLALHFQDLQLEPSPWRTPPAIWRLLLATAPSRDGKSKSEDVPPQLAGELTRAILTGSRYPRSLLSNVIMRLRADGDISGARVALCKGVLARERRLGVKGVNEGVPVSLDINNTDAGYLLGRLFSTLENIQRAALGKQINATIRDRYYGAASATPAIVFPMLVRNAQHHLSRVKKDKPGFAVSLEKEVGEIVDRLGTTFPKNLRIEAQGHFAIGYYHQTQARYSRSDGQDATESEKGEKE